MKRQLVPTLRNALRKNPGMFRSLVILFVVTIVCGKAWALDEFQGLTCGADIAKSLVGKRSSDEGEAVLKERHKDLGLRDLGGVEISNRLFLTSWRICGNEYELLLNTKTGLILDVLLFPHHSGKSPQFIGTCHSNGKQVPEVVIAVLDNSEEYDARDRKLAKTMLHATAAWTIDQTKEKFAKRSTENLTCPLGGIISMDGGP